ncbi:hypothetical protein CSAL01_03968 [Colletotrichum salicis]|uniref:Uncharacterized protein n=1 Tax=Colletotrichum salicis TaxID=1209931 RepID=A0A135UXI4_9PEZI|nr:hypothetical protein CSAL01_03968 [Colletotrichum salicis]
MPKEGFPRKDSKEGWASAFGVFAKQCFASLGIIVVVAGAGAGAGAVPGAALSSPTSLSLSLSTFAYRFCFSLQGRDKFSISVS